MTMKTLLRPALAVLALACSVPAGLAPACRAQAAPAAPPFRAAAARIDITPQRLDGLNPMTGKAFDQVHDPIFARLLLLQLGRQEVAYVAIDAIEVGNMDPYRARIARQTGLAADHIVLSATHDHNAPRLGDVTPGALAHPGGPEVMANTDLVVDRIVAAIAAARAHLRPARYGIANGSVDANVNRDQYVPGKGWTLGFDPHGPSDKVLHLVRFDDESGAPIAVILDYPIHANVMLGANVLSGDVVGVASRLVEDRLGTVALFAQGAIDDQAPRLFEGGPKTDAAAIARSWRLADAQGVMIGMEALRLAGNVGVTRPARHLDAAQALAHCPAKQGVNQLADMKQASVGTVPLHLSVIRFDDVALAGVGGEVLTGIYRHLQAQSPLANTLLVSLANDRIGYLPEDSAYDRPLFEVNGSPLARGCGEAAIVEGLTALIAQTGP